MKKNIMGGIDFTITKKEKELLKQILLRAVDLKLVKNGIEMQSLEMDIIATHKNGCELDLLKLLNSTKFDFKFDIYGINYNIDREFGKIRNCFEPRSSK